MEQGFSDACVAICMGQVPVARVAQTCRSAAIEMPRPTVRKWCEHGYNKAYEKTKVDLEEHWHARDMEKALKYQAEQEEAIKNGDKPAAEEAAAKKEPEAPQAKIISTIPITLNENDTFDLNIREGQNVEDAVVFFCRENVKNDVSACIRQLLPEVLEKFNEQEANSGLRGGA
jgi:hypothetical protein|tara:strand:+ start:482 stop:1000 length:519 start_codon:yes stop_codon:yes gene_type:complete